MRTMNFFRLLLLAAAVYIVLRLWRRARPKVRPPTPPGAKPAPDALYEPMARCSACGAHSPQALLSATGLCSRCRG